jgi:hypothetical protein
MAADEPFMLRLPSVLAGVLALGLVPAVAHGAGPGTYLPPSGKVFSGLTGSTSMELLRARDGNHPGVFGFFTKFGGANEFIFRGAEQAGSRLHAPHLHAGRLRDARVVTPQGIAEGGATPTSFSSTAASRNMAALPTCA